MTMDPDNARFLWTFLLIMYLILTYGGWALRLSTFKRGTVTWRNRLGLLFAPLVIPLVWARAIWHGGAD